MKKIEIIFFNWLYYLSYFYLQASIWKYTIFKPYIELNPYDFNTLFD